MNESGGIGMNIVIVGLGNIGGSFALSLRENAREHTVYAIDVDEDTLEHAEHEGIIRQGFTDPEKIIPRKSLPR